MRWINSEEESFGRTLDRGSQLLDRLMDEAERFRNLVDRRRRMPSSSTTPTASPTT